MFICKTKDIDNIGTIYQRILNEKYYSYEPPADFIKCIGDFYLLDYFNYLVADKKRTDIAPTHFREDDDLKDSIVDAYKKLIPYLKKTILGYTFYAITSEMTTGMSGVNKQQIAEYGYASGHPFGEKKINDTLIILSKKVSGEDFLLIKKFYVSLLDIVKTNPFELPEHGLNIDSDHAEDTIVRSFVPKILNELGISNYKFVEIAKICFNRKLGWANFYGGKNWQNICDAYLRLDDANSFNEISVAIDHVIDLEHNTGSVFSKIPGPSADKPIIALDLLAYLLDLKASISDYRQLLQPYKGIYFCSGTIRLIGQKILKERTQQKIEIKTNPNFIKKLFAKMSIDAGNYANMFQAYHVGGSTDYSAAVADDGRINYIPKDAFLKNRAPLKDTIKSILDLYDVPAGVKYRISGTDSFNLDFWSGFAVTKACRLYEGQLIFADKNKNIVSLEEWNKLVPQTNLKAPEWIGIPWGHLNTDNLKWW
jgi:hypothetical protein